jgi:hypothetical protein
MQRRSVDVAPKALQRRGKVTTAGTFLCKQLVDDRY